MSRHSSVGIVTDYGMGRLGSIPGRGNRFSIFRSVQTGSVAHLAGQSDRGVELTTYLHLVPRSGMVELYVRSPPYFFML
jgi:hypothetical protein